MLNLGTKPKVKGARAPGPPWIHAWELAGTATSQSVRRNESIDLKA